MPGLVDFGVVFRTALRSGLTAFFACLISPCRTALQVLVASTVRLFFL